MRSVAVDDGLWYLHNQMSRTGNEEDALTGAQITGTNRRQHHPHRRDRRLPLGAVAQRPLRRLEPVGLHRRDARPGRQHRALPPTIRTPRTPPASSTTCCSRPRSSASTPPGRGQPDRLLPRDLQQEPIFGTDDGVGLYIGYVAGELRPSTRWGTRLSAFSVAPHAGLRRPGRRLQRASSAAASSSSSSRWSTRWCGRRTRRHRARLLVLHAQLQPRRSVDQRCGA
jgi:hypothetical protein